MTPEEQLQLTDSLCNISQSQIDLMDRMAKLEDRVQRTQVELGQLVQSLCGAGEKLDQQFCGQNSRLVALEEFASTATEAVEAMTVRMREDLDDADWWKD